MDGAPDLVRHGLLGRFPAPVEADYQAWLVDQIRPLVRISAAMAVPVFLLVPALLPILNENEHDAYLFFLYFWGLAIPIVVLVGWNARRPKPYRLVETTAATLVVAGVGNVAAYVATVPDIDPGSFLYGITVYCMIALVARLPFRTTLVTSVLISIGGLLLALDHAAGPPDRLISGPNATLPLITLVVIPGTALLGERTMRERFVAHQLFERQQHLLAESRLLLRRYAPSSVVSRIELGDHTVDHPQRRKVTIFFSDVVGFTTMADRVDPEALAEIVDDYLGSLADLIERHGGTLNEFAGDGVMAIFGAPDEMPPADQVLGALAAAQELQASLPAWSRGWYQHGIVEDAQARIGINTGTVSVGTFGSAVRATYTGIGLQTNIAARVQAEAEPGKILLSNTSWHLVKDTIACEPRGEVMVKGVHFPIELYEPTSVVSTGSTSAG